MTLRPIHLHYFSSALRWLPIICIYATLHATPLPRILVFSETAGWDHQTRNAADSVIGNLGSKNGFQVIATRVSDGFFTDNALSTYSAVCFTNTTGTIFTAAERAAFERYIKNGGGYVGIHASTDCEYDWQWYGAMTGANFNGHPFNVAAAKVAILDKNHSSTSFIKADTLLRTDEWYFWGQNPDFRNNPLIDPAENSEIHVLMNLVESSIQGSSLNHFHPICWYREHDAGRVWYCGLGHDPQTFNDTLVKKMLLGGIQYAAGMESVETAQEQIPEKRVRPTRQVIGRCIVYTIQGRVAADFTHQVVIPSTAANLHQIIYRYRLPPGRYLVKTIYESAHLPTETLHLFQMVLLR